MNYQKIYVLCKKINNTMIKYDTNLFKKFFSDKPFFNVVENYKNVYKKLVTHDNFHNLIYVNYLRTELSEQNPLVHLTNKKL